jgi:molecular chaperone GrpE
MSGQPKSDDKTNGPATAAGGGPAEPGQEPEGAAAQPATEATLAPELAIAALEGQIADLTDRLLRAHAEMDNMRKRAEKERADVLKYAVTRFASDVLAIGDNLQRAIMAVPVAALENDAALRSLLDGVTMTEREFLNVLARHGIKKVDPRGEAFNPHLHQAVMEQQNVEVAAGTVLQVFQPGYTIEERVLRPAMVAVAKGGSKPMQPAAAAPAPDLRGRPANDDSPAGVDESGPPPNAKPGETG